MKLGQDVLYLSNEDIAACELSLSDVHAAVETMFRSKADGSAQMKPKLALHAGEGALFLASPGVMSQPSYAGVKWVGVGDNAERGLPHIAGTILLNDGTSGMPVAIMDARWVTAVRTAAISAVAARRLARPESAAIGFIACGLQARAHLDALRPYFPLERVLAYSRRLATAEAFAEECRAEGFDAEAHEDPHAVLEAADIVVTSTPVQPKTAPFLDAGRLRPGSFAAMVDLGFSWEPEPMRGLDRVVTDDIDQAGSEKLTYPEPYDGEVAGLVSGDTAGRQTEDERTALVFAGVGLADVAVGAAVYERALEKKLGTVLPL